MPLAPGNRLRRTALSAPLDANLQPSGPAPLALSVERRARARVLNSSGAYRATFRPFAITGSPERRCLAAEHEDKGAEVYRIVDVIGVGTVSREDAANVSSRPPPNRFGAPASMRSVCKAPTSFICAPLDRSRSTARSRNSNMVLSNTSTSDPHYELRPRCSRASSYDRSELMSDCNS